MRTATGVVSSLLVEAQRIDLARQPGQPASTLSGPVLVTVVDQGVEQVEPAVADRHVAVAVGPLALLPRGVPPRGMKAAPRGPLGRRWALVAGQKVALGRIHQHRTVTVLVSETTLAIELPDSDTKIVRRTTTQPVRSIKGQRPRTATSVS
jgi:hypothetical protein